MRNNVLSQLSSQWLCGNYIYIYVYNMPDSFFHENMRQGITFFWCGVILLVFLRMKEMESVLSQ